MKAHSVTLVRGVFLCSSLHTHHEHQCQHTCTFPNINKKLGLYVCRARTFLASAISVTLHSQPSSATRRRNGNEPPRVNGARRSLFRSASTSVACSLCCVCAPGAALVEVRARFDVVRGRRRMSCPVVIMEDDIFKEREK